MGPASGKSRQEPGQIQQQRSPANISFSSDMEDKLSTDDGVLFDWMMITGNEEEYHDTLFQITFQKAQSHISMVFDLVSYKSQLLESQIYMRMPDTCHPRMRKICPINNTTLWHL